MTKRKGDAIALYHVVYRHEDYEHAARALFETVKMTADKFPGQPRALFLDIEGHRTKEGAFDREMWFLLKDYILGWLSQYLTEIHIPLPGKKEPRQVLRMKDPQSEDVPERVEFRQVWTDEELPDGALDTLRVEEIE